MDRVGQSFGRWHRREIVAGQGCFKSFKPVEIDLLSESKKIEGEGKLRLKAPRQIVLRKTVEGGSIKQNFSHGRSKSVVVEVRRKKTFVQAGDNQDESGVADAEHSHRSEGHEAEESAGFAGLDAQDRSKQHVLTPLSPEERKRIRREHEERQEEARFEGDDSEHGRLEDASGNRLERGAVPEDDPVDVTGGQENIGHMDSASGTSHSHPDGKSGDGGSADSPVEIVERPRESSAKEEMNEASAANLPHGRSGQQQKQGESKVVASGARMEAAAEGAVAVKETSEFRPEPRRERGSAGKRPPAEEMAKVKVEPHRPKPPAVEEKPRPIRTGVDGVGGVRRTEDEGTGPKKKMTRAQREDVARKKTEALVTKRLAQLDELREQKRLLEERRKIETEEGQGRKTLKTKVKRKGRKSADPEADKALSPRKGRHGRGRGGRGGREELHQGAQAMQVGPVVRDVIIPEAITVAELASRMAVKASEVVKLLFDQGMMVTINQVLDQDTAVLVVEELGHRPKTVSEEADIVAELAEASDSDEQLIFRPPVVTIMGHVDHGKTSLLDAIRQTDVASREYGGITQHIGAYQVTLKSGAAITFIDTPGHAAFTAMRSRGAKVTDLVVLVVAADDGVMPQTVEAINHAKDARVPIIVAVNKMDKVGANPERVKQQLTEHELIPEEWGGQTIYVNVSALSGTGIESLEEMILLQSEVLGLKANPNKNARGTIVEAKLDKGRGAVATCLVQNGTLAEGDIFVVGQQWGRVRTLINDRGKHISKAGPSVPVEIIGLSGVPEAGDELVTVQDEKRAKDIASFRQVKLKEQEHLRTAQPTQLDDLFHQIQKGELDEIKVVVKGDVRGSVEAVAESLMKIEHPEIRINVIHTGVGGINESDVMLAVASDAVILGFNVRADAKARELAKREKIDLRFYTVIYDLLEDMTRAMEGRLAPTQHEVLLGIAAVREVFRISKVGNVAGCVVTQGVIPSRSRVRVLRDSVVIHDGKLLALKRFKDDTKEVREGQDCGMSLEKFNDFKPGDMLEAFLVEEVRQTIVG
ncbi:MAG: bacterial translation initiation factor 2 (bIF-2) [Magnetococcales bacterium]|nr:bacterial translation initiation factor 2 (bIF-2) [Magnetococcales bacterium]